jgi:hypothetical protein
MLSYIFIFCLMNLTDHIFVNKQTFILLVGCFCDGGFVHSSGSEAAWPHTTLTNKVKDSLGWGETVEYLKNFLLKVALLLTGGAQQRWNGFFPYNKCTI